MSKSNNILVVGDWSVDEYWVLAKHQSPTSANTGHVHYRVTDQEIGLCGAGQVARVLFKTFEEAETKATITGAGFWDDDDETTIKQLMRSPTRKERDNNVEDTVNFGSSLGPTCKKLKKEIGIELVQLAKDSQTHRIIRQYLRKQAGGLEQLSRFDWNTEFDQKNNQKRRKIPKIIKVIKNPIIVIFDLIEGNKGVITQELITELDSKHVGADWYIRSKELEPKWLQNIKKGTVKLLLMGPELTKKIYLGDKVLVGKDKIKPQIQNKIDQLMNNPTTDSKIIENIVLVSSMREMIALGLQINGKNNDNIKYFTAALTIKPDPRSVYFGWTTAFFASLIYKMINNSGGRLRAVEIKKVYTNANNYTRRPFSDEKTPSSLSVDKSKAKSWSLAQEDYKQATEKLGIITRGEKHILEIFRSYSVIPGYVACIKEKQEIIQKIGKELRTFSKDSLRMGSVSIMLTADPGAGKTYFAKKLSETFDFTFLPFDITQMVHRDDLLDLFDRIANEQAKSDRPVLVYVDEINASLEGHPVYGAFLSLLESGTYVRHEGAFGLKPCAWLFTGTMPNNENENTTEKLPDFVSRLRINERIDFKFLISKGRGIDILQCSNFEREVKHQARLEQVYLGALAINQHFPSVQKVSRAVLRAFHEIDPSEEAPARKISQWVISSENITNKITETNCNRWEGAKWPSKREYKESNYSDFVELDFKS